MIKKWFTGIALVLLFSGCLKSESSRPNCNFAGCATYDACSVVAPSAEIAEVQAYLNANSITAVQHCSGLFYAIDNAGNGTAVSYCSGVNATYTGKLTNGTVFDSGTIDFCMSDVIRGWINGLPLVKKGGKIRLYIPPTLGYGSVATGPIPGNSVLVFDVTVNDVY